MSDIWELVFDGAGLAPNDDEDGDGQNNLAESLAGTHPFDATSRFALSQLTRSTGNVTISWPNIVGKQYQAQRCTDLVTANWIDEGNPAPGTGSEIIANYPTSQPQQFWRVMVHDLDTDVDGVADWEELQIGFNPTLGDSDGDGTDDLTAVQNALTATNIVTVIAPDFSASETGADPATFLIARTGNLNVITVSYTMSGSASNGVDYAALSGSVTLPIGVNSATITLTPLSDNLAESGELVTLTLNPSAAYDVGNPDEVSAIIADSIAASGTGLLGKYFDNSSPTYSNPTNFTGLMLTRMDPTVNFDWLTNAPIPAMGTNSFSVIWTGQVQPEHSEAYTFHTRTDDGVKLWVNGALIINAWTNTGPIERTGTIALAGGVRYDIRMEYFEGTLNAMAKLSWYSPSQTKQIIPQSRLYPSNVAPSAVTSPLTALGLVGGPLTYTLTGSNQATDRDASGLPPGLTFTPGTGLISGTPTSAGTFHVLLRVTNAVGTSYAFLELTILEATGSVEREFWSGVSGASVSSIPVDTPPTGSNTLTSLQGPVDTDDDYGARVRGTITAPLTGTYRFWIASDGASELWISGDDEPNGKVNRAWVATSTLAQEWTQEANQKSTLIALEAGHRYYFEVLHKEATGPDHFEVGWLKPGESGSAPSEIVPGYVLSPFVPPGAQNGQQTLYIATLTPQSGAMSSGSGLSTLRVNAEETEATLTLSYGNLTTPTTSIHVHDASHGGAIIFDLDDAPQTNGVYYWTLEDTGGLTVADIVSAIESGNAYLNVHSSQYPNGEIKGFYLLMAGSQTFTPPPPPPPSSGGTPTPAEAARFLTQCTFGPNSNLIAQVQSLGYETFLDQQFGLSMSSHLDWVISKLPGETNSPNPSWRAWWTLSTTSSDQVRQRVAFALSEIMVVSQNSSVLKTRPRALSRYYDVLLANAFGNFRQLLEDVTLNPAMGLFLDMRMNDKPDLATGRNPNENYSREVLQLFSIGLKKLHPDGTLKLDSEGLPIPTYDQDVVVGFAHVFTGWNWHQAGQLWPPPSNDTNAMTLVESHHSTYEKLLLDNVVLAAGQPGAQDLQQALDAIFNHPNVGPFICRQLIQRLVTSNPSPGYIYRVASAFNDNGQGVRGDLKAVIKAILLDHEARSPDLVDDQGYGHGREPVIRAVNVFRALHGSSPSGRFKLDNTDEDIGQTPLRAPTVFNFFEPDYIQPGEIAAAGLFAPEFQITTEITTIKNSNFMRDGIYLSTGFKTDVVLDLTTEKNLASDPAALVDHLDVLLMCGQMPEDMRTVIVNYVSSLPGSTDAEKLDRAKAAVHLVVTSPQFAIQR